MNYALKIFEKVFSNLTASVLTKSSPLYISPLYGSSKSILISELAKSKKHLLVLMPDEKSIAEMEVELNMLQISCPIITIGNLSSEFIQEKLALISKSEKFVLLAIYGLLQCKLPSKKVLDRKIIQVQTGADLTYENLLEYLRLLKFTRDKFVETRGCYSQRGAIIDFWSYGEQNPVRLEFDGDFIESIRYFDPDSQRSIEFTDKIILSGALEASELESVGGKSDIFDYIQDPVILASNYELQNSVRQDLSWEDEFAKLPDDNELTSSENDSDDLFPEPVLVPQKEEPVTDNMSQNSGLLEKQDVLWIIEDEINSTGKRIELGIKQSPSINSNFELLANTLIDFCSKEFEILIACENEIQSSRLVDLLTELNYKLSLLIEDGKLKVSTIAIKKGFILSEKKLAIFSDYEIFNKPYRTKLSKRRPLKSHKSKNFASIKKGDFVVHEDFGIGKYVGLETISIGDVKQESMKILYNEGGVVYVNLNYLSLVKKYSSNQVLAPTLSTLGTAEWVNTKQKTKKKIKEAARELIELYAKRKATNGFEFSTDTIWQKELEASFQYEDTPDQAKVTEEVKSDMQAPNPMDRLICGDVGFGKTEIAIRAAFKAAQDGKQTAVLVPTTILAEQHFNTFTDRLANFPVKAAALSRFQSKKEQSQILKELAAGTIDVLIGTHRIISKDVQFKDLGLLIIDEEHRFGVKAKEKLRSIKVNVDTLSLTATPIPRTLNLSLLGARDLSIISTPPPNRQPIYTHVSTFDIFRIKEWILNEVKRNGQVYFVHDRVHSIDKLAAYIKKYIPEIRLAVAHGQMKPSQLENVVHDFLNKKYDVLLSTKIIESGIDIPNVNTIIVNKADRFGLAELHQLRGRVGRSIRQAYAYFIVPSLSSITKKALRRLEVIEEYTEIGSGFNLSMRDLEIRGAGNLLGTEQTGFINEIGFDLYIKLINEAVEELKYQEFKDVFKSLPGPEEKSEPSIDTFFEIGIPVEYMPDQVDRLDYYAALYSVKSLQEIADLKEEIIDRFGPLPILVKRLIETATLKLYASHALFDRIIMQRKNIFIILPRAEKEDYYKARFVELMRFIMNEYKDQVRFNQQKEVLRLIISNTFSSPDELLRYLIEFCDKVSLLFSHPVKSSSED
ncbi:MAG: transcription-repair coupling factor [Ignavibacteriaceae bacterium]|nr:transcription-repair coupling factor [Ignavibacteriaceae bacterium]